MYVQTLLTQTHFRALSQRVHVVLQKEKAKGYRLEMVYFLLRFCVYLLGIGVFSLEGVMWKWIGVGIASFGFYAVAITGTHETRHGCFRPTERSNRLWAYFFSDFWAGQSNRWWHHRHVVVHHTQTNIPSKEPSLFYYPWIQPFVYFFVAPFFVNVWLFWNSVLYLRTQKREFFLYLLLQTVGWIFHVAMFAWVVSIPLAIVCAIGMRAAFAPAFMHIAVFNHIGLPELDRKPAWLAHQSVTTRNLKRNIFLDVLGGNAFIECHIEHHLFPNVSNQLLGRIRPIVRAFLREHGYAYVEEGYLTCLKHCFKAYHQIFARNPIQVIEM